MMAQSTFSVRMDEALKQQFDSLCSEFGMSVSTAITVFAKTVVREKRIPFEISANQPTVSREDGLRALLALRESARVNGVQGMPLSEINAEIRSVRQSEQGDEA